MICGLPTGAYTDIDVAVCPIGGSRISVHHVVFGYVNGKKKTTGGREIERENVTKLAKSIILDLVERGRIVDHIRRDTR